MKVVILAGGFGTRIAEESHLKPKPMIEIGNQPILWHIMKYYASYGFDDFVILGGYRQYVIKEYFADFFLHNSDVTFDLGNNRMEVLDRHGEDWRVTVLDTGYDTMTGGRVKRARSFIGEETFMLTYGDGLADVDITALLAFHRRHKKIATITTVNLGQEKGVLEKEEDGRIKAFREKEAMDSAQINGGFMVLEPEVFDYIEGDKTALEKEPMQQLAAAGELMGFHHTGFWQCMDTQRERKLLEELWAEKKAPWKRW